MLCRRPPKPAVDFSLALTALLASFGCGEARNDSELRLAAVKDRPVELRMNGYTSSETCRACHPDQYASWHRSYHRTMTRVASPETVRGRFDGQAVAAYGNSYRPDRHGDEFWLNLPDPSWKGQGTPPPRIDRRIVLTTGSHHMQAYWYATGEARKVALAPLVFLFEDQRWVSESSTFLRPPGNKPPPETAQWNQFCHQCHATGVEPRVKDLKTIDTRLAELGIACEACHGPCEEHVRKNRNPVERYRAHLAGQGDATAVNPTRLEPKRAAQVCGQCHSIGMPITPEALDEWKEKGHPYRPGQDLNETRYLVSGGDHESTTARRLIQYNPHFLDEQFWSDGMVRVSGREYQGLLDSPCYKHGSTSRPVMTCLSCHAMHQHAGDPRAPSAWADDQLKPAMDGNAACLQCHEKLAADLPRHTHHLPGSPGSLCYNCHMPHTTYGLLKAIRSHTISSPSVESALKTGRPDACSQCHLDKPLAWTSEKLADWFGHAKPALGEDQTNIASGMLWTLSGDAGQRAIAAWSLGWADAERTAGTEWMAGPLAQLLEDPYDAVRYIAYRSLRRLPGFADVRYDFLGSEESRQASVAEAMSRWTGALTSRPLSKAAVLIDEAGRILTEKWVRLVNARDDRRVNLLE